MKMVRRILFILLSFVFLQDVTEAEQKVLAVQGLRIKPYEESMRGFKSVCNVTVKEMVISEWEGLDIVKEIRKINPDMILAVGIDALSKVKGIKDVPIVYFMVPNPQSVTSEEENITGISMNISPEKQLGLLREVLPDVNRVGLLYNPAKTGYFVKKARDSSRKFGIKLIVKEVYSSREVPLLINDMKKEIDAFWMLPDTTVITPETIEFLFLFSLENKMPLIAFSDKYTELGAVMSVGIDAFDTGRQAGEMAKKILSGTDIKNLLRADARKAVLSINLKVVKKLRININNEIINKARIIN